MFTCGMVFVDTTDGVIMRSAYGWALINPIRKVYYNLTVTIVSVVVAFGVGGIEILTLVGAQLQLTGPFWDALAGLNFETIGLSIIVLFVVAWAVSVAYWKYKRFDERFAAVRSPARWQHSWTRDCTAASGCSGRSGISSSRTSIRSWTSRVASKGMECSAGANSRWTGDSRPGTCGRSKKP